MAAYYILRPVRDAMASDWSNTEISVLWNLQLVLSTAVVALYGLACSRIRFKLLVPAVYVFFAVTFVGFYLAAQSVTDRVLLDKGFYLWVSLFSLFHLSVFWSFMADLFSKEQSRRVFAFIAAGASAGAAAGPLFASLIVTDIGTDNLMLVASVALLVPIPILFYLQRLKIVDLRNEDVHADLSAAKIGGNPLAGFKTFFTNPYLLAIGAFFLLFTTISSFVYFEQTNLLRDFTREERTVILSGLAAVVNILTFGLGMFATSRLVTKLGMPITLALVPVFICVGLLILAFAPILTVLLALQVARQGGNYGITRPAREMLFTNVDRETRFKAKPVIDVAVYRGGDAASSIAFAALTDGLGLGMAAMAAIGAGIAAVWAAFAVYLGRAFNRETGKTPSAKVERTAVGKRQQATT
jgi:AAA family ATP:ADP antiporter